MSQQEQWYTMEERKLLHKDRYFTTSHNYFFEVKEAKNGSPYIVIDQRKKVGDQFVSAKLRIFEDEMLEFERILHKLIHFALNVPQSSTPLPNTRVGNLKHPVWIWLLPFSTGWHLQTTGKNSRSIPITC
jgi:hypothetical protein